MNSNRKKKFSEPEKYRKDEQDCGSESKDRSSSSKKESWIKRENLSKNCEDSFKQERKQSSKRDQPEALTESEKLPSHQNFDPSSQ